ncbi:peptidoglycan-binding protein [Streptomyces sp. NPDC017993]|uniref:peptidoglycan-binding protein n=1 Tax=Streptomyces sp. NPDC017993 TaxID=3365027 RepID=UPI0037AFEA67
MTAETCPHCFAPVRGDGLPTCLCAAVGAEDFDPLHIRPYVSLREADGDPGRTDTARTDTGDGAYGTAASAPTPPADAPLAPLPLTPLPLAPAPPADASPVDAPSATAHAPALRRRVGPTSRTFTSAVAEPMAAVGTPPPGPRSRRTLPAVLAVAGAAMAAAVVLIATDALSGGDRHGAALPDQGTVAPTAAFPTNGDAHPPTGSPSPTSSPPPAREISTRAAPDATLDLYRTSTPSPPVPTRASGSVTAAPGSHGPSAPPTGPIVLREGSSGPEVEELQDRLGQLALYVGEDDGRYDADVRAAVSRYQRVHGLQGDPDGVYGAATRASLESRTREP